MNKLFVVTSLLLSTHAFAWGPTGHRVVGHIAEKYLTPTALKKTQEILKGDSLAKVANWPDEIRSEPQTYSQTYVWHYTEWKDNTDDHTENETSGQLLNSIKFHIDALKNDPKPENKSFSLKFIVHLIGDLHQPYHVGNGLDRGGNLCKVLYFNNSTNLHKVWDEDMIDSTKMSFTEIADFANQGISAEKIAGIQSGDANDWAKESKDIRSIAYPVEVSPVQYPIPMVQNNELKSYCNAIVVAAEFQPKISYDYNYKFMSTLNRRLLEGGLRLAMVLNQALDESKTK